MTPKQSAAPPLSPNQRAWRRFRRNRPAVFGLVVIIFALLIAILGYWLAIDDTPHANDQLVEVQLKNPGFRVDLLAVRRNAVVEQRSAWSRMWYGQPNPRRLIPITDYRFHADSITVSLYEGEEVLRGGALKESFALVDVIFPLPVEPQRSHVAGLVRFRDRAGQLRQYRTEELQQIIKKDHLFTRSYPLGSDIFGRCLYSRLILGVRISLLVGLIAVFISLSIGIVVGALAGYLGGWVDDVLMLFINTIWSIPTLLLVFAIVLALGRGIENIFIAVGLTMWVEVARIVRGQVMVVKRMAFVEAAQSMGLGSGRILLRHILPNVLGPVMVVAAANFATAILVEAGLSYLGFGIEPPQPSWGTMLNENYGYAISGKPLVALVPALAILLLVLAFNLVGNGFRDALDVKA
ncbi:MAG: ABC transporter permease [Bacteroidota bacterium]